MTPAPFPPAADFGPAQLGPINDDARQALATALAAVPPWSTLGVTKESLARYLAGEDDGARRYAIEVGGALAGVVCIRFPWLKGPYIELLAILPAHQGQGIGSAVLSYVETEAARAGARNVWVCASEFNSAARRFYERSGFAEVGSLPDLVTDGFAELLLRKRLA